MMTSLPILRRVATGVQLPVKRSTRLLLISHLLPTAVAYVDCLSQYFDVHCIGIPYSSHQDFPVLCVRAGLGARFSPVGSLGDIGSTALALIEKYCADGHNVVVQEIGGYLAEYAKTLSRLSGFLGVVEDTNNGHWRYDFSQDQLQFPVVSIARSPIKSIEDRLIGDAVVFSLENVLRNELFDTLEGKNALVLGYGKIGRACARALRGRRSNVYTYDRNPLRLMGARADGIGIGARESLLADAQIVLGATGNRSVRADDRALFCRGAVLASASSRDIEFDMCGIAGDLNVTPVGRLAQYSSRDGAYFYIANSGFPVNFLDNSALGWVLDAIYSELFLCIVEVANKRAPNGLSDSNADVHRRVADAWRDQYICSRSEGNTEKPLTAVSSAFVMKSAEKSRPQRARC